MLFNVDDLCPTNAPRRCVECKGPYHIRKRCPKLISLSNEKEKLKRLTIPSEQILINNQYEFYRNNSQFCLYPEYNYPRNVYSYPFQIIPHQRVWTQPYSNEGSIIYPNISYYQNDQQQTNNSNRSFYSQNQRRKQCYRCGSPNHLIFQCPQNPTNSIQR
jgi:hypothetical protein